MVEGVKASRVLSGAGTARLYDMPDSEVLVPMFWSSALASKQRWRGRPSVDYLMRTILMVHNDKSLVYISNHPWRSEEVGWGRRCEPWELKDSKVVAIFADTGQRQWIIVAQTVLRLETSPMPNLQICAYRHAFCRYRSGSPKHSVKRFAKDFESLLHQHIVQLLLVYIWRYSLITLISL